MSAVQENRFLPQNTPRKVSRRDIFKRLIPVVPVVFGIAAYAERESGSTLSVETEVIPYIDENIAHMEFPGQPVVRDWDIKLNANAVIAQGSGRWEAVMPDGTIVGTVGVRRPNHLNPTTTGAVKPITIEGTDVVTDYVFEIVKPEPNKKIVLRYFGEEETIPSHILEIPLQVSVGHEEGSRIKVFSKSAVVSEASSEILQKIHDISQYGIRPERHVFIVPSGYSHTREDEVPQVEIDAAGAGIIRKLHESNSEFHRELLHEVGPVFWEAVFWEYLRLSNYPRVKDAIDTLVIKTQDFQDGLMSEIAQYKDYKDFTELTIYQYILDPKRYSQFAYDSFAYDSSFKLDACMLMSSVHDIMSNPKMRNIFINRLISFNGVLVEIKNTPGDQVLSITQNKLVKYICNSYAFIIEAMHMEHPASPGLDPDTRIDLRNYHIFSNDLSTYPPSG